MTTYLIGYLLTFLLWIIVGRHDGDKLTIIDVFSALVMGLFSWIVLIPAVIGLIAIIMSSVKGGVLWRRKK